MREKNNLPNFLQLLKASQKPRRKQRVFCPSRQSPNEPASAPIWLVACGNKGNLTRQQFRTIKGQALAGDIEGARKGMHKLLERRSG